VKRISERAREEAAVILSVISCTVSGVCNFYAIGEALGFGFASGQLASDTWHAAHFMTSMRTSAEAESLLRTGWSP
jgi:hypothetical protein